MNGDVNGTMAEPMEVTLPSSPDSKSDLTKVTSEDCDDNTKDCENSMNAESDKEIDSDSKNGTDNNCLPDESVNENSNDLDNTEPPDCTPETTSEEKTQEHTEDNTKENHCDNSNESNPKTQGSFNIINIQETDKNEIGQDFIGDDDSEDESNAEEGSVVSGDQRAEDTVSINSLSESDNEDRDETSQECQNKKKINDRIMLGRQDLLISNNTDIQEIESDNEDCVVDGENKTQGNQAEEKTQLRRSSRSIKRKRYTDEVENGRESDIEEVDTGDSLRRKMKPIVINDTKALVAMAANQMKANVGNNQKKEPTVVIIETNSFASSAKNMSQISKNSVASTNSSASAQSLYQSIVARGTTVTPVSSKNINNNNTSTQATQNTPQPAILPSLTDDMFVVEAPSFIVPYVYEKPSVKPFREFVDKLGKELEEEKIKEDLKEKEKREKERQERKDKGEVASDDEKNDKTSQKLEEAEDEASKKKKSKRDRRRRTEEDDDSWDGESASESDEALSDEDDKIVVKDKAEPIDQINVVADLTADKICLNKSNGLSSMDCSLGKFFINIGLNLVQEYVQSDLLKQQNRKLYKEKKAGHSTKATESSIAQLMKNLEFSKENNAPYSFPQKKCEFCSFKTESQLVMAQHLETPHMKNNVYKCNFCTFEIRSPHDILYHMEAEHNVRGKLERAPSYHQCANCPFEDNGKGKLARHLIACAKKFKPDSNLAPPVDWEPPAKIPKIARPRNNIMSPYQNAFNRGPMGTTIRAPMTVTGVVAGGMNSGYRPRGRSPMAAPTRSPVHGVPIMRGPSMMRHNTPGSLNLPNNFSIANNTKPKSVHQPSISITPLPRQPQPVHQPQPSNINNSKNTFVICEICDGYIKDLEQLRNHMQWIHKVKIHPKMIYNRPPLNCQKCQFRFFTDQGLERHLLGSHGLVTSSMQEAANKGKDAGRCPVCGRVYQWKLLNHVARDHNITLKPAHLSYKCTVCTATFGMYKQFENHVYSAHSVVAKRVMDKSKTATPSAKSSETLVKPLKINDEITIIPQSVKALATTSAKDK